jgi:MoaA/NifB/PqqE/SkfB family radical SAM enzyme
MESAYLIKDSENVKQFRSPEYNYIFNKRSGVFARWGKTPAESPEFSPFGNEILDCEISTICNNRCKMCYKSNTNTGVNMSLNTWKKILSVMPNTLTQVAFGIGSYAANPETLEIIKYTRSKGIIPNLTVAGNDNLSERDIKFLAKNLGAVSISVYDPKEQSYDLIEKFTKHLKKYNPKNTLSQVNVHQVMAAETQNQCYRLIQDKLQNPQLKDLNAIVYLQLKKVGRGVKMNTIPKRDYEDIIKLALDSNVGIGFDSCGAGKFLDFIKKYKPREYKKYFMFSEPCEAYCFSSYINVLGEFVPCSFCEGNKNITPVSVLSCKTPNDFMSKIWLAPKASGWRQQMKKAYSNGNYNCMVYDV